MTRRDWIELAAHLSVVGGCLLGLAAMGLEWVG